MELRTPTKSDISSLRVTFADAKWTYSVLVDCFDSGGNSVMIPLPDLGGHEAHHLHLKGIVDAFPDVGDMVILAKTTLQGHGHTFA
jgi:hypothetical protein